ncbi:uncharacterized protein LOC132269820 [Cornus florida]|uniref:uncharacterized protein LOC132269820 n=1 Tax=Cornus florida TaxID=4283 RepID=UPI00289D9F1A|nr:uncharacterized protein LOC132269820 [Cornus florida]
MEDRNESAVMGHPPSTVFVVMAGNPRGDHNQPVDQRRAQANRSSDQRPAQANRSSDQRPAQPNRSSDQRPAKPNQPDNSNRLPTWVMVVFTVSMIILELVGVGALINRVFYDSDSGPHPPKFRVDSVSVSPSHDATVSGWNMSFHVGNPNKDEWMFYEEVGASIFYKQVNISSTAIAPFYVYEFDCRSVEVTVNTPPPPSITSVTNDGDGDVNITMIIDGTVRRINKGDSGGGHRKKLSITCEDVKVGFSGNSTEGKMLGESRECKVYCK